jgi:hypothetical protein
MPLFTVWHCVKGRRIRSTQYFEGWGDVVAVVSFVVP